MKKLIAAALIVCATVARGDYRSSCEQYASRPVVPRARIRKLRHQRRLLRRSTRKTHQSRSLRALASGRSSPCV